MEIGHNNLLHSLEASCTDPDCEIHNPHVGFAEEVVTMTDLAFFYAGATSLKDIVLADLPDGKLIQEAITTAIDNALAKLRDQHILGVKP